MNVRGFIKLFAGGLPYDPNVDISLREGVRSLQDQNSHYLSVIWLRAT